MTRFEIHKLPSFMAILFAAFAGNQRIARAFRRRCSRRLLQNPRYLLKPQQLGHELPTSLNDSDTRCPAHRDPQPSASMDRLRLLVRGKIVHLHPQGTAGSNVPGTVV